MFRTDTVISLLVNLFSGKEFEYSVLSIAIEPVLALGYGSRVELFEN